MDKIHINDIKAFGYLGGLTEGDTLGHWFEVDLTLSFDLSDAGTSDALGDTYSYVDIVQKTKTLIETQRYKLIERLADEIASHALNSDSRIQKISVKVTKTAPPIPNFSGSVAVEIERVQQQTRPFVIPPHLLHSGSFRSELSLCD